MGVGCNIANEAITKGSRDVRRYIVSSRRRFVRSSFLLLLASFGSILNASNIFANNRSYPLTMSTPLNSARGSFTAGSQTFV